MKEYYYTKATEYSNWETMDPVQADGSFYEYLLDEIQNAYPNYSVREEAGDWFYILNEYNEETGEAYHVYKEIDLDATPQEREDKEEIIAERRYLDYEERYYNDLYE